MSPSTTALPKNWPPEIRYLTESIHHPNIRKGCRPLPSPLYSPAPDDNSTIPKSHTTGPNPLVRIQPIINASHPAHGQHGLFATRDLKPGSFIIVYRGIIHRSSKDSPFVNPVRQPESQSQLKSKPEEGGGGGGGGGDTSLFAELNQVPSPPSHLRMDPDDDGTSDYDLTIDRDSGLSVDAAKAGNEARFINDYRGMCADGPNAEFRDAMDEKAGEMAIGVWVLPEGKAKGKGKGKGAKGIRKGEEILVSYGKGFWEGRRRRESG